MVQILYIDRKEKLKIDSGIIALMLVIVFKMSLSSLLFLAVGCLSITAYNKMLKYYQICSIPTIILYNNRTGISPYLKSPVHFKYTVHISAPVSIRLHGCSEYCTDLHFLGCRQGSNRIGGREEGWRRGPPRPLSDCGIHSPRTVYSILGSSNPFWSSVKARSQ